MISGISASLSALYAFGSKLSNIGHNVANVNTIGYKKTIATINEDENRLPRVNLMQSDQPGAIVLEDGLFKETSNVDLAKEFPQMLIARRGYEANISAFKTQSDLIKSVIDMLV